MMDENAYTLGGFTSPLDRSGDDLDLMGDGRIYPTLVLPDPDSGETDCLLKDTDGTCPAGCCECAAFRLGMENLARIADMGKGNREGREGREGI